METDADYMRRCAALGRCAAAEGNSPVGSLIVRGDEIISEAGEADRSKNDVTCHAEIEAIRGAVKKLKTNDLSDCTMYSTHEPCVMCAYAIRFYGIRKVVYQHAVSHLGGDSSTMPVLTTGQVPAHWSAAPEVVHFTETISEAV
jgi:tRNA(adenine34) deaminase